jgi:ubiquinone/menaquinone biosynthesis C-methylase UbiE
MFPPREGKKVLDVGCGTGIHLRRYQKAGCNVYGIDMSPSMLRVSRQRLGKSANLCLGDASHMPYPDNIFDLIIITLVIHEMPPHIRSGTLFESKRILHKNGRILLIDYNIGPIRPLKGWLFKSLILFVEFMAGREHFKNFRNFLANRGLPRLIENHGLSVDKQKIVSGGNIALYLLRLNKLI